MEITISRPARAASVLLPALCTLIAFGVLGTTLYGVVRFYSPVPYLDEWDGYPGIFRAIEAGIYRIWWIQHVDHRIVTTRLVAWLDWKLFGGMHVLIVACQIALQAGCVWLLARGRGLVAYLLITAALFSWSQKELFVWSFAVQIGFVYFFALLAHYFYRRSLPAALTCAIISTFSMANGVFVFVSLAVHAAAERRPKDIVSIAVATIVTWSIYFSHYVFGAGNATTIDPVKIVSFVLVFFGQPLYPATKNLWVCAAVGAMMLALVGARSVTLARAGNGFIPAVLAFLLLSALAAAHGRASGGASAAIASRYAIGALILWSLCLIAYVKAAPNTTAVVALVLLGCVAVSQADAFASRHDMYMRDLAVFETAHGLDQPDIDTLTFPSHDRYLDLSAWAKKNRIGVFKSPLYQTDTNYDSAKRDDTLCTGFVDMHKGAQFSGWVIGGGRQLVLVDAHGATVGRGLVGAYRPDLVKAGVTRDSERGWVAYTKPGAKPTEAFLVTGDRFCRIGDVS